MHPHADSTLWDGDIPILTKREYWRYMVEEFRWALENRPNTFTTSNHRLIDHSAHQAYWISNGSFGFQMLTSLTDGPEPPWWYRLQMWNAFLNWRRKKEKLAGEEPVRFLMQLYVTNHPDKAFNP